ncbi:MAG: hypothetical protein J2P15_05720 [Micromonosporaceae bacterium]|nr:hypothetical protein [Micromonosporaceae bacterium]
MNEDELRMLLGRVEAPPSRVDLAMVLREGQRVARRRRYAVPGVAALTVLALVAVPATIGALRLRSHGSAGPRPSATPTGSTTPGVGAGCPYTLLPVPAGLTEARAEAVDPAGRYIAGWALSKAGAITGLLWTDGRPQVLAGSTIGAINEHGVAVGIDRSGPFRYRDGQVTRLHLPAGYTARGPLAINAAGDIITTASKYGGASQHGMIWPAGSDTARFLPTPLSAEVDGIDDDGTMVGLFNEPKGRWPVVWDKAGNMRRLETPGPKVFGLAFSVRDGWAAGRLTGPDPARPTSEKSWAAVWDVRTGKLVFKLSEADTATHVNSAGWFTAVRSAYDNHGQPVPLAAPAGYTVDASAITETNLVVGDWYVGGSSKPTTVIRPVTWQC